jgi:hypothetical protein
MNGLCLTAAEDPPAKRQRTGSTDAAAEAGVQQQAQGTAGAQAADGDVGAEDGSGDGGGLAGLLGGYGSDDSDSQ